MELLENLIIWDDQEEFDKVIETVEAISSDEQTPEMIRELSFAYCEKAEYGDKKVVRDAIDMLYQCEEDLEDDSDWNLFLGLAHYYIGEPEAALSHFDYCLGNKRIDEDYLEMMIVDCEKMCASE